MSTTYKFEQKVSVSEQADDYQDIDVAETWDPQPSVEQESQARIDYADDRAFEGRLFGQTLEAEERMRAREWEVERTRTRMDRTQGSDREARCRADVRSRAERVNRAFAERAGSVDRWQHPEEPDPRERMDRKTIGSVNAEAKRICDRLGGWTRAAVSRLVAERVVETGELNRAVLRTFESLQVDPGSVVPIGRIGEVRSREVSVEGTVVTLWAPSHPRIAQVGLLEDDSGRTKFTSWKKSGQPVVQVGDTVTITDAAKSWYNGRCSIALTGRTRVGVVGKS